MSIRNAQHDMLFTPIFRYPSIAELAYGSSRRGCFENPNNTKPPTEGLDCPDIAPVEYEEREGLPNPLAMNNSSQLVSYWLMLVYFINRGQVSEPVGWM
jgi:hypothetical protein